MICPKCEKNLDKAKFYHDRSRKSGRSCYCKTCMYEYNHKHRTRKARSLSSPETARTHRDRYPDARKAGKRLAQAIKEGRVKKSNRCQQRINKQDDPCNETPTIAYWKNHDYSGESGVLWLCHRHAHKRAIKNS